MPGWTHPNTHYPHLRAQSERDRHRRDRHLVHTAVGSHADTEPKEEITMGKNKEEDKPGEHEDNSDYDGYKKGGYDHETTKDVDESSGGRHSKDDK